MITLRLVDKTAVQRDAELTELPLAVTDWRIDRSNSLLAELLQRFPAEVQLDETSWETLLAAARSEDSGLRKALGSYRIGAEHFPAMRVLVSTCPGCEPMEPLLAETSAQELLVLPSNGTVS